MEHVNILEMADADLIGLYRFEKNCSGLYSGCNERFAQLAGLAHENQLIGASDYDFPWAAQAPFFQKVLDYVLSDNLWINRLQPLSLDNRETNIVISLVQRRDEHDNVQGISGYFVDLTTIQSAYDSQNSSNNALRIGKDNYENITPSEVRVLKALLTGKSNAEIASRLCLSKRTIDSYLEVLKEKLSVESKTELVAKLYRTGVAYLVEQYES